MEREFICEKMEDNMKGQNKIINNRYIYIFFFSDYIHNKKHGYGM